MEAYCQCNIHAQSRMQVAPLASAIHLCSQRHALGSFRVIAILLPPFDSADELPDFETQRREVQRTFGGRVASNAVTVNHVNNVAIQVPGCFSIHLSVREVDRAGDVLIGESLLASCIHGYYPMAVVHRFKEIRWIHFKLQFVLVVLELGVHKFMGHLLIQISSVHCYQNSETFSSYPSKYFMIAYDEAETAVQGK